MAGSFIAISSSANISGFLNINHLLSNPYVSSNFVSDYNIKDISLRAHAEGYYDKEHTVQAGVEVVYHKLNASISEFSTQLAPYVLRDFESFETAVYLQDQWKFTPTILAEIGARATSYACEGFTHSVIEPRFSFLADMNNSRLFGSISTVSQFVHPYRNSGVFMLYPALFWYTSAEGINPTKSTYIKLGIDRSFKNGEYLFSLETYYKLINNLHEFYWDSTIVYGRNLEDFLLFGSGYANGVNVDFRKRFGALSGMVIYNLSRSFEKFRAINYGKKFTTPFARKHEIQMAFLYSLNESLQFSLLCIITSSNKSLLSGKTVDKKLIERQGSQIDVDYSDFFSVLSHSGFIDVNGGQLPGFRRIEIGVNYSFILFYSKSKLTFRLISDYGIIEPFEWHLTNSNVPIYKWYAALKRIDFLPLYPALELHIKL